MNSIDERPSLRAELTFQRNAQGELEAIEDPVVGRKVNLGPFSRVIVPLVDGNATTAEILETAASRLPGADRAALERTFRTLVLLNLLDGSGTAILGRVRDARAHGPGPAQVPEGSRFACQGSGSCCHHYALGPLSDADRGRIERIFLAGSFPEAGPGPWIEQLTLQNGQKDWFLKKKDDHCIFLTPDEKCGIHAKLGEREKPGFCQLYPYRALATVDGLKLYDSGECATFAVSALTGPLVADRLAEMVALLPERHEIFHPVIFLSKDTPCDFGHVLAVQKVAADLVAAHRGTAPAALVGAIRLLRGFVTALAACPLRRGEPDATVETFLAGASAGFEAPPERPGAPALRLVARLCEELVASLLAVIVRSSGTSRTPSLEPQFAAIAKIVEALALEAADPDRVLVTDWKEIAAIPASAPELQDALRTSLRIGLYGDRVIAQDRLAPGVARLAFVQLLAVVGGKLKARLEGVGEVRPVDLSFGHKVAARVLRGGFTTKVFLAHEDDAWEIALAAVWLASRLCS